ncbi:MAG: Gfo/Idh/MocA family oxidoreductase [Ruminococcaceae bacterium]|nr:Gfo/Idh/MocA family oxidoreductase [Oscillospiraceae bacterium]
MIKIGIIGCGGIANGKHLPSLSQLKKDVELVAFCDIVEERAQKAKEQYGTVDAKVYTDYRDLLADPSIDVVHVLTPNRSHAEISIASLEAGKHVMCEKPMAKTAAEAEKMVEVAKKSGKKLTIGYQARHAAESRFLKQAIEAEQLGEIYYAQAKALRRRGTPTWGVFLNEYEQGGGPLIDIGTHSLDLTLYMMNNYKPRMVVGTTYKKLTNPDCGNPWGPWDEKQNTVEDSAFGFIVMENGATIQLGASWCLNIDHEDAPATVLCGTKAGAKLQDGVLTLNKDEFGRLVKICPDTKSGGVAFYEGIQETPANNEASAWIDCIKNDTDPVVLPEQACVVSQILEAIYRSAKTGKPVYFAEGKMLDD